MATSSKKDAPQGASPKSQSPRSSPPPPPIEYTYMYEKTKMPTTLLDALLRAIARHIICEIGDPSVGQLTPKKLAAFYKAVGGDYDELFLKTPHDSISYMWQVTGCQHTLQPIPDDDFVPPTIPALTPRGFSRWESLEILLGPEEHVPFLQFAVKNWKLRHPDTGQEFPPDLPKSAFPSEPDIMVDRWHKDCAYRLNQDASTSKPRESTRESTRAPPEHTGAGSEPDHGEPKVAYAHVRKPPFQERPPPPDPTYFERPVSYNHVPGRHANARPRPPGRGPSRISPERYERARERGYDDHSRRRSFSDYNTPRNNPPSYSRGSTFLDPNMTRPEQTRPEPARRHSQPRHVSSDSSDDEPIPPRTSRRPDTSPPNRSRFVDPSGPHPSPPPSAYRHRSDIPTDEERRRPPPNPSLREKVAEKVSNILPNGFGSDRPRNPSRPSSYKDPRPRRSREFQPSRLSRSYSDLESDGSTDAGDSEDEYARRKRTRDERDRERFRDSRGRSGDFDREDDGRDRRYLRRPEVGRRTSSHADMDRRRDHPAWDPRNRDQREDKKRWEKRMAHEDRGGSPMSGRRYPETAYN